MLPAAHRLRTAADFQDTTRRGRKAASGSVVVYVRTSDAPLPPRLGLIVGKKVGNSVLRHRASRRIRHVMRPILATLPAGTAVVVRALPGAPADPALAADLAAAVSAASPSGRTAGAAGVSRA